LPLKKSINNLLLFKIKQGGKMDTSDTNSSFNSEEQNLEELSHSDKIAGIITEPAKTFEATAKFPPRTIDWVLPIIILLLLSIVSQFILFSNPEISYQMQQKQREVTQKLVQSGKMTQEQADKQAQFMTGPTMAVIRSVSILIFGFIFFLIITGIYFLFCKFALKGDGNYISALVANGLTAYVAVIQIILATVFSIILGRMMQDVSVASLLGMEKTSLAGWLLSFIDIITIWSFSVLSIGLAKMFKSQSTVKYFILVFGLWFVWKLAVFGLGNAIPFLKNF
jgi:hypothetical protein